MTAVALPGAELDQLALWKEAEQASTFVFDSPQLERDKYTLIGVPHVITAVSYREPTDTKPRGYVSIEAFVAPAAALEYAIARGWVPNVDSLEGLKLEPSSKIIYNDGSTGIRRQLTQMFHNAGMLDVGGDPQEKGARFDRSYPTWASYSQRVTKLVEETNKKGETTETEVSYPQFDQDMSGNPLSVLVKHGLRVSEYGEDSVTFYLG